MLGRFGIVEVFFVVMLCILIPVGLRNRDKRNAIEERLVKVEKAIADLKTEK